LKKLNKKLSGEEGSGDCPVNGKIVYMKVLIVCASIHHGNTWKVAKVIADTMKAKLIRPHQFKNEMVDNYELIGFGSGVYMGRFHRSLRDIVQKMPKFGHKKAFMFSTSGLGESNYYNVFIKDFKIRLMKKGFEVVGSYNCKGWDTISFFKYFGGLNKGRPNKTDLDEAAKFAEEISDRIGG
jgi:flavodoxin